MSESDEAQQRVSADRLVRDFKVVVADAEALLKATAEDLGGSLGEKAKHARERLKESLEAAKSTVGTLESKAVAGVQATDRVIREHPYQSLGIAAGAGLLLGLLMSRR